MSHSITEKLCWPKFGSKEKLLQREMLQTPGEQGTRETQSSDCWSPVGTVDSFCPSHTDRVVTALPAAVIKGLNLTHVPSPSKSMTVRPHIGTNCFSCSPSCREKDRGHSCNRELKYPHTHPPNLTQTQVASAASFPYSSGYLSIFHSNFLFPVLWTDLVQGTMPLHLTFSN